jgi:alcohol dehydrogenase (cytochrome c)
LLHKSEPFVMQSANMFDIPGETPITRYPGINGGSLWSTPSVSPLTHYFYVMGVNQAYSVTAFKMEPWVFGAPTVGQQTGGSQKPEVTPFPPSGTLTAIDVNTGKIAWQQKTSLPMYGGIVTTASNLLFTGEMNGDFDAFDAKTGKKLWHYYMGVGVCSPPITYRVKGRAICRRRRQRLRPWPGISGPDRPAAICRQSGDLCGEVGGRVGVTIKHARRELEGSYLIPACD